jgi:hypothetical protein
MEYSTLLKHSPDTQGVLALPNGSILTFISKSRKPSVSGCLVGGEWVLYGHPYVFSCSELEAKYIW